MDPTTRRLSRSSSPFGAPAAGGVAGTLLLVLGAQAAAVQAAAAQAGAPAGTVAGRVTDASSRTGLAGVALVLEGTRLGATTGSDGRYRITNVPPGPYVVVTRRIGFGAQRRPVTVAAGAETAADFAVTTSAIALDQVVVTGTAGAQERRAIGNAVSTIAAADERSKSVAPDLASLLNARAAGVVVVPRTGRLGAGPSLQIRGRSSLSLDNGPLVYIDGVRVNNATSTGPVGVPGGLGAQAAQVGGRLNDINPEDIESIEIIKGPAAATVYGTEAANGVVQIITKKGALAARPQITMLTEQGSLYFRNPGGRVPTNYFRSATTGAVETWNGVRQEADSGRPVFTTGQTRRYSGAVAGGRDALRYYVASSYENDLGIEPNNRLRQFAFHANLNSAVRPSTDVATSLNFVTIGNRLGADVGASPLLGAQVGHALVFPTTRGFFAAPPEVPQTLYDNRSDVNRFTGSATLTNRPAGWFTQRGILGLDYTGEDARAIERFATPDLARFVSTVAAGGRIGQTIRQSSVISADYAGTAKARLARALTSSSSVGGQLYRTELKSSFLGGTGFPGPGVELVSAVATQVAATQSEVVNTTIGAFGEQQVAWRDRVFVTAGLRVDNNSAFGADFKWITYPKVGASWVVSDEPFLRPVARTLNTLRLRAAYGQSGRQPNAFAALRTFTPVTGPNGSSAVTPGSIGNANLRPERGKEVEAGFEAGLFDRVTLDFTYFNKRTSDVIVNQPVAPSAGFPGNQVRNLGRTSNHGVELTANVRAAALRRFAWDVAVNFSTNRDQILDLGGLPSLVASAGAANVVGYPIGGIFARRVVSADRDATTGRAANVLCDPGNGGAGVACATAPFVYIGTPTPRRSGAVANTFTLWQRLRLYALVDFKGGNKLYNAVEQLRCTGGVGAQLCEANYFPERYSPVYLAEAVGTAPALGTIDQYIQSAAFAKLREVSATYTLPERWLRGRASVTLAGRELHTWTKYRGIDPESNANSAATTLATLDQAVTPPLSRIIATVNVSW